MSEEKTLSVTIMDREFKVKCPPDKTSDLQEAALYLDEKMRDVRSNNKILGVDRVAVIAALNVVHELLLQQKQTTAYLDNMKGRIQNLQAKIDAAISSR